VLLFCRRKLRREFITLIGGAAAAWPLVARATGREHPAYLCAHILGGMNMKSADLPDSDISHILEERGKLLRK
jgi:hypothetical protein